MNESTFVGNFFCHLDVFLSHCFSHLSAFLSSFRNNWMHSEIIDHYFNVFFIDRKPYNHMHAAEKRKLEKRFLGAQTGITVFQTAWIRNCLKTSAQYSNTRRNAKSHIWIREVCLRRDLNSTAQVEINCHRMSSNMLHP